MNAATIEMIVVAAFSFPYRITTALHGQHGARFLTDRSRPRSAVRS